MTWPQSHSGNDAPSPRVVTTEAPSAIRQRRREPRGRWTSHGSRQQYAHRSGSQGSRAARPPKPKHTSCLSQSASPEGMWALVSSGLLSVSSP